MRPTKPKTGANSGARADVPSKTESGTSRNFCHQTIKYEDKRTRCTSRDRVVHLGCKATDASNNSPGSTNFEKQKFNILDESSDMFDQSSKFVFGSMTRQNDSKESFDESPDANVQNTTKRTAPPSPPPGLCTGLVGFFNNLAVENISGFKLLLTSDLLLDKK
ncbi:hypothetical protein NE237_012088 [Protea cynaroides]|uniref:Uncharacterized protein n=1 Tax=Protea cynaroides TaxID=273540 RepID=A0A9Q0GXE2_9MAGN|nr:hypothetical protein NE237_012088 [Protea cynaroides]